MLARLFLIICVATLSCTSLVQCNLKDDLNKLRKIVFEFTNSEEDESVGFEKAKFLPLQLLNVSFQFSAVVNNASTKVAANIREKAAKGLGSLMNITIFPLQSILSNNDANEALRNAIFKAINYFDNSADITKFVRIIERYDSDKQLKSRILEHINDFDGTCNNIRLATVVQDMNVYLEPCLKTSQELEYESKAFETIRASVKRILTKWVKPIEHYSKNDDEDLDDTYFAIRNYIERTGNISVVQKHISKVEKAINKKLKSACTQLNPQKVLPRLNEIWRMKVIPAKMPSVWQTCPIALYEIDLVYFGNHLSQIRKCFGAALFLVSVCSAQKHPHEKELRESVVTLGERTQQFMHMVAQRVADKKAMIDLLTIRTIAKKAAQ